MSALDTIKIDLAKYGEPVLAAIAMIQRMTGIGGESAASSLAAIDAVVAALVSGAANNATPDEILADLSKLDGGVAGDDSAADRDLAARFPSGGVA